MNLHHLLASAPESPVRLCVHICLHGISRFRYSAIVPDGCIGPGLFDDVLARARAELGPDAVALGCFPVTDSDPPRRLPPDRPFRVSGSAGHG